MNEAAAMAQAIALAESPDAPRGPNPRVGCVLLDATGDVIATGYHRGAGTPHAEVVALAAAGERARGATAVVSLEPCRHVGRTGPCTQALIDAGVRRVVYAQDDPTVAAGGGAADLVAASIEVAGGVLREEAERVNREWTHRQRTGRPFVTLKVAVSLDGRVADATGGPTAITGTQSAAFVHELRGRVDAIAVGTGTVIADDPHLTARAGEGLAPVQPLRVVIGKRRIPDTARVLDDAAPTVQIATHDPADALARLAQRSIQHVLLEGGPQVATAFLAAGLVDEIVWLVAPRLLGAGPVSLHPLGRPVAVDVREVRVVGNDVAVIGSVRTTS